MSVDRTGMHDGNACKGRLLLGIPDYGKYSV